MPKNKNGYKLYNVLFPFWMILLFPQVWLIVLPGNFIIDRLVLLAAMAVLCVAEKKTFYRKHILWVYAFGMLADIIGAGYMLLLMTVLEVGRMGDELYLTLPALAIAAVMIFVLNYFITFKGTDARTRLWSALIFALVTAPYTYLIPSSWLY